MYREYEELRYICTLCILYGIMHMLRFVYNLYNI